jgi:hypothetical protein
MQKSTRRYSGEVDQLAALHCAQAAISVFIFTDDTLVAAYVAANAVGGTRWLSRQIEFGTGVSMNGSKMRSRIVEMLEQALTANANS